MIKLDVGIGREHVWLKQANKSVQFFCGEANSKNKDFLWIINEADNFIRSVKGQ